MWRVYYIFSNPSTQKKASKLCITENAGVIHNYADAYREEGLKDLYIFSVANLQTLHDWMLALMVLCFVVIDLVMLVVFSAVEGLKGKLGADRVSDDESHTIEEGVRNMHAVVIVVEPL